MTATLLFLLFAAALVVVTINAVDWSLRRRQRKLLAQGDPWSMKVMEKAAVQYRGLQFVAIRAGPLWGDLRAICLQVRNVHYTRAENISALLEFVSAGGRVQECEAWWISHPDSSMDTIRQRTSIEPGETALLLLMYQDHDRVLHWSQVQGKDILEPGGWTVSLIVSSDTVEGFAGQISFAYNANNMMRFVHPAFKFAGPVPIGTRSLDSPQDEKTES